MRQFIWNIVFPLVCKDRDEFGGGVSRNKFCSIVSRVVCGC